MKFLYQPVENFTISQKFGENRACVPIGGGKVITCDGTHPPPGYKALYDMRGHLGIDIPTKHGQPVYATHDGVISLIDTQTKSGLDVKMTFIEGGKTYRTISEHLLGYQVKVDDHVKLGDCIGWADNTGYSSGDHLHFQLEEKVGDKWVPIDPLPVMRPISALKGAGIVRQLKEIVAQLAELLANWGHK